MKSFGRILVVILLAGVAGRAGYAVHQGHHPVVADAPFVALGSSYAAGLGLGPQAQGTFAPCRGSINGYPQQLAHRIGLTLTDMSCSGATIKNILYGGQFYQGPQLAAIGPDTKLVTLTGGGNDILYTHDLFYLSFRDRGGIRGFLFRHLWSGAKPAAARDFAGLQNNLNLTLQQIRQRAPHARIVIVNYVNAVPLSGTCPALGLSAADAALMRQVAGQLATTTRAAASANGAILVDVAQLSAGHDACSATPWVNGATPAQGVGFHPNLAGATIMAQQVQLALSAQP